MEIHLQEIIANSRFHSIPRGDTAHLKFPKVGQPGPQTFHLQPVPELSDIAKLKVIPSESSCQSMLDTVKSGSYSAISCSLGAFSDYSLETLLKIHELSKTSQEVKEEKAWLKKCREMCDRSSHDIINRCLHEFEQLLMRNPAGKCIFEHDKTLLAMDVANLTCKRWLNYSVLHGVAKILQADETSTYTFILNDLLVDTKLNATIRNRCKTPPKYLVFFANVGRSKEVFFSSFSKKGCHWTLLYIDIVNNKWYYCDTLGWDPPTNLKREVKSIMEVFYNECKIKRFPFKGCTIAHSAKSHAVKKACSTDCLPNMPLQLCGNICGVISAVLGAIAAKAPALWKEIFLSKTASMPEDLAWFTDPTGNSDYLRGSLISWLTTRDVNIKLLGVTDAFLAEVGTATSAIKSSSSRRVPFIPRSYQMQSDINSCSSLKNKVMTHEENNDNPHQTLKFTAEEHTATDDKELNSTDESSMAQRGQRLPPEMDHKAMADVHPSEKHDQHHAEHSRPAEVQAIFAVGKRFTSLTQLEEAKSLYEKVSFCELWKRDVRTLEAAKKRVPKRVSLADQSLKYYSLKFTCKFGGKPASDRKEINRQSRSFRQGCSFAVYLTLSTDGKALEVMQLKTEHNHIISEMLFKHLPRQRQVAPDVKNNMKDALRLQANSKLLQQKIATTTGCPITLKDIANLKYELKKDSSSNEMETLLPFLLKDKTATVEVMIDDQKNFNCLFYQDQQMRRVYSRFPEMLMVDATYKLLDLKLPVYILLAIDGHGLSEIIGLFIVAEETETIIQSAIDCLKKNNPSWENTRVIMTDKDFNERNVLERSFPQASMQICLYHALRSFRREITMEKMGITSDERTRCLEIFSKIIYSKSTGEYEKNVGLLKDTKINSVIRYYNDNWDKIKEQWVSAFKDTAFNLGETTNNRLESMNAKIKSVCCKYGSLMQFFTEFFVVLSTLRNERIHSRIMSLARRPTSLPSLQEDLRQYADCLTPYAFQFVQSQAELADNVRFRETLPDNTFVLARTSKPKSVASANECDCNYMKKIGLPCRHIFKVRSSLGLSRFESCLISDRWTIAYCEEQFAKDSQDIEGNIEPNDSIIVAERKEHVKVLSEAQKYKKALKTAQALASVACEGGMKTFDARMAQLKALLSSWKTIDCSDSTGPINVSITTDTLLTAKQEDETLKQEANPEVDTEIDHSSNNQEVEQNVLQKSKSEKPCSNEQPVDEDQVSGNIIKMPKKMLKRGRPKGAELTVIGIPRVKKLKGNKGIIPFTKLWARDKEREILECFVSPLTANKALDGALIDYEQIEKNSHKIPDMVKDEEYVDLHRVERYFSAKAWTSILRTLAMKRKCKWVCSCCTKAVHEGQESIACERCLSWYHFKCVSMSRRPKSKYWFCRKCKSKYTNN